MPQAKPEALQVHRVLCHTLHGALSPPLLPEHLLVFPRALQRARAGSKGASSALGLCEQHSCGCDSTWQPAEPTGSSSPFPLHLLLLEYSGCASTACAVLAAGTCRCNFTTPKIPQECSRKFPVSGSVAAQGLWVQEPAAARWELRTT